jgi:hypothetical protein
MPTGRQRMATLSAKPEMPQAPSLAPFGRLFWVPETEETGMVFIQGAGLTRVQIDRSCPPRVRAHTHGASWWQLALSGLFRRNGNI